VAGTILELGEGVQGLSHGQRVMAGHAVWWLRLTVVVPASDVMALGRDSPSRKAPRSRSTMRRLDRLVRYGSLRAGERVLIHAAGWGIGIAATQTPKPMAPVYAPRRRAA